MKVREFLMQKKQELENDVEELVLFLNTCFTLNNTFRVDREIENEIKYMTEDIANINKFLTSELTKEFLNAKIIENYHCNSCAITTNRITKSEICELKKNNLVGDYIHIQNIYKQLKINCEIRKIKLNDKKGCINCKSYAILVKFNTFDFHIYPLHHPYLFFNNLKKVALQDGVAFIDNETLNLLRERIKKKQKEVRKNAEA